MADLPLSNSNQSKLFWQKKIFFSFSVKKLDFEYKCLYQSNLDRLRMAQLDLNVNPANDDITVERRRQLKLSFQADAIKAAPPIIKSPPLPERTR